MSNTDEITIEYTKPPRAVLCCIQISTDFVLDSEGPLLVANIPGVELRLQKLQLTSDVICADTFYESSKNISVAASALMPIDACTVAGLSCTSMSFSLGPDLVDEQLRFGAPKAKTTDMARAQVAALRVLGVTRIALVTPYLEDLSLKNAAMLEESAEVKVVSRLTMELPRDELTSLVSQECIARWALAVNCDQAEAVVIGCSAFRACTPGFIDGLEKILNKPVVTSTQAFLWAMLRTANIE
eukprot:CAMPEP_0195301432 /NCGR_PEP_ID=MMETSP0707-20130614/29297_1 /TAXON_ID=33640 /ORGANISM="Asterionellopsis glacialis, Strain CCMP134" /LENGTH=241 /DNA_ID=CAMNT_0040364373 /DNA_START=129 /DNA_END=851 /DNA_ORIENTATION=-